MGAEDALDEIAVYEVHGGDGDGAELIFDFNGQRIAVSIFPGPSGHDQDEDSSSLAHLISLLDRLSHGDMDDNEHEQTEDDVLEIILEAGKPLFKAQALAPPKMPDDAPRDLHSVLYPTMHHYRLLYTDGKAAIISFPPGDAYTIPAGELDQDYDSSEEDELEIDPGLPCYSTRSLVVEEMFVRGNEIIASRVVAGSAEMFCKAQGGGLIGSSVEREMRCLLQLHEAQVNDIISPDSTIRVPRLLGYVRHADTNRIVGFLRQWVPGRRLRNIDVSATPAHVRQKWLAQLRETVDALHTNEIIWSDGTASNVVIDEQDDAWLIDFGGGWTKGWVDENLADTVEGDEQAIRKITEFLKVDNQMHT